ncbi:type II toxin-antitoxin system VapC family toxin [Candidatus Poriferisodalis sp.]|uniref:type II toxin-antitoxin system VapC family toxin n=1 Tax=Candidatus Poriferisodalis sp. TaxID=3101277 RepID=UPI003C6EDCA1
MIVVDASVAVTAVGTVGERTDRALRRISLELALAPHVLDLEVVSAFRRMYRRGEISEAAARRGLRHLARVGIRRVDHTPLIARCWELRDNLTPCDASYVALAEQTGATLLTSDARLSRAPGIECDVELFDAST